MIKITRLFMIFLFLLLGSGCRMNGSYCRVYHNLGNPTQYRFNSSQLKVNDAINELVFKFIIPHIAKVYKTPQGQVRVGVFPCYSSDYWSGFKESDVDWPEAGKIGQIDAQFNVNTFPLGQQTLVTVEVGNFVQETGRTYVLLPDFHKTGVRKDVKSDTYFEYVFLRRLSERLGETNMPTLKSAVVTR